MNSQYYQYLHYWNKGGGGGWGGGGEVVKLEPNNLISDNTCCVGDRNFEY